MQVNQVREPTILNAVQQQQRDDEELRLIMQYLELIALLDDPMIAQCARSSSGRILPSGWCIVS